MYKGYVQVKGNNIIKISVEDIIYFLKYDIEVDNYSIKYRKTYI